MAPNIRVLVVDDSVVIRRLLTTMIDEDPELEVAGVAHNGLMAVDRVRALQPDIVTLDIEMPELDGLGALRQLRPEFPKLPIVMFSTLTEKGGAATLDALALGASDYVTKPANVGSVTEGMARVRDDLLPKIKALCGRSVDGRPAHKRAALPGTASTPAAPVAPRPPAPVVRPAGVRPKRPELVVIGSSTGGPNALHTVLEALPADLRAPVLVTQHMPPVFTRLLAERLDEKCKVTVHEAQPGMTLQPGHVYIAPGDFHLVARQLGGAGGPVKLDTQQEPPVNFCRPAVDVMFRSVAQFAGPEVLAVILTGMGSDGREGCRELLAKGAHVIAQDRATSVVWGMPGAVVQAGLADEVLPLDRIGPRIAEVVSSPVALPLGAGVGR